MKTKTAFVLTRCLYFLVTLTVTIAVLPPSVVCQTSRSHNVTVTVNKVTVIAVNPPAINLDIPSGPTAVVIAGVDQMTVTDQTTTLLWGTNSASTKITISSTTLATPLFSLQAVALSPSTGSPQTVTLSTGDQDFITNMLPSSGSVSVRYTGIALASAGEGTDTYTVTFSIIGI
ncbi:MAG: hypothetical protein EHM64_12015 [Ignavibacteriae bacterium]|nr:MAG: hypothetical protein EHM64_12015 [Ignavibacteriota bacterium]